MKMGRKAAYSSWLLHLPQAVPTYHEPEFDAISTSYCLFFYLEASPEGTLCSTWDFLCEESS